MWAITTYYYIPKSIKQASGQGTQETKDLVMGPTFPASSQNSAILDKVVEESIGGLESWNNVVIILLFKREAYLGFPYSQDGLLSRGEWECLGYIRSVSMNAPWLPSTVPLLMLIVELVTYFNTFQHFLPQAQFPLQVQSHGPYISYFLLELWIRIGKPDP